ncbi:MAG: hypothetical protein AAF718_07530 [Pseudomonadota bacterium]
MKEIDSRWQSVYKLASLKTDSIEQKVQLMKKRISKLEEEISDLRAVTVDNTEYNSLLLWEKNFRWRKEKIKKNYLIIAEIRRKLLDIEQVYRQTSAQQNALETLLSKK